MRKLLLVLVLAAACVIGLGFYLDWFSISTTKETPGKTGVNVTIDQDKIKSDAERAQEKAKDVSNRGTDRGHEKK